MKNGQNFLKIQAQSDPAFVRRVEEASGWPSATSAATAPPAVPLRVITIFPSIRSCGWCNWAKRIRCFIVEPFGCAANVRPARCDARAPSMWHGSWRHCAPWPWKVVAWPTRTSSASRRNSCAPWPFLGASLKPDFLRLQDPFWNRLHGCGFGATSFKKRQIQLVAASHYGPAPRGGFGEALFERSLSTLRSFPDEAWS